MGKQAAERRLADTEASAFLRALRISPRKLNLVAQSIRGKDAATPVAEGADIRVPYWDVTLSGTVPLADLLGHLYVLVPVLDPHLRR